MFNILEQDICSTMLNMMDVQQLFKIEHAQLFKIEHAQLFKIEHAQLFKIEHAPCAIRLSQVHVQTYEQLTSLNRACGMYVYCLKVVLSKKIKQGPCLYY